MRLGVAFGAVYYYNTSPIFADEAICTSQLLGVNRWTMRLTIRSKNDARARRFLRR
jgi:hypothetical protein